MKNRIIRWIAGSAAGRAWTAASKFLQGKKTYFVGASLVLQGGGLIAGKIAATPDIGAIADLLNDPEVQKGFELISQGLGFMTVRAGISKVGSK